MRARHRQICIALWIILAVTLTPAATAAPAVAAPPVPPETQRQAPPLKQSTGETVSPAALAPLATPGEPVGAEYVLANMSTDISNPAIAYNTQDREYLVVWQTDGTAAGYIYATRVAADGRVLGNYVVEAYGGICSHPDVAYNAQDNDYLIVWQHDNGSRVSIHSVPFSPGGPIYSSRIINTGAAEDCFEPAVAYATSDVGGDYRFIVVWERHTVGALSSDIVGQALTAGNASQGTNFVIKQGITNHSYSQPDIAYNRSRNEYLVVWTWHNTSDPDPAVVHWDILGRILTRAGLVLGTGDLVIGYHGLYEWAPAVAAIPTVANYGGYLVVWEARYTSTDGDIYSRTVPGRIVADPGTLLGNVVIVSNAGENQTQPAAAAPESNRRYLVTWTEAYPPPFTLNVGIRGQEMSQGGALWGARQWLGGAFSGSSAVAAGTAGDFLGAWTESGLFGDVNIWGRIWGHRIFVPLVLRGGS